jgi:hypothetical protein
VKALGWDDWFMLMATVQNPRLQFGKRSFSRADSICGRFSRQRRT